MVIVVRLALHLRAQVFSLINMAKSASEGFFQRAILVSSLLSKYVMYANFKLLSLSVKVPAREILLHMFWYFEQSCKKIELAQWSSISSKSVNSLFDCCSASK